MPEEAPGWQPGAQRTTDEGIIECQECDRWGDDCVRGGQPHFNTACAHYKWVPCGRAPAQFPKDGKDIGQPILVPNQPAAPPPCNPPKIVHSD